MKGQHLKAENPYRVIQQKELLLVLRMALVAKNSMLRFYQYNKALSRGEAGMTGFLESCSLLQSLVFFFPPQGVLPYSVLNYL